MKNYQRQSSENFAMLYSRRLEAREAERLKKDDSDFNNL